MPAPSTTPERVDREPRAPSEEDIAAIGRASYEYHSRLQLLAVRFAAYAAGEGEPVDSSYTDIGRVAFLIEFVENDASMIGEALDEIRNCQHRLIGFVLEGGE